MEEALDKFECQIIRDDGAQKTLNCDLSCTLFTQWALLNLIAGFFFLILDSLIAESTIIMQSYSK